MSNLQKTNDDIGHLVCELNELIEIMRRGVAQAVDLRDVEESGNNTLSWKASRHGVAQIRLTLKKALGAADGLSEYLDERRKEM